MIDEALKILLIDGNTKRRQQNSSRLRMQNFIVELAQGGFHAIHLAEENSFNLVIIHGNELEEMPTEEVISLIRSIHPKRKLPILAIIDSPDDDYALELDSLGASRIIINSSSNFNVIVKEIKNITQ